jgi:hypothetical protein
LIETIRQVVKLPFTNEDRPQYRSMRALLALLLTVLIPQIATAEEWRYCLAPSHADHKVYMSMPFAATMSMDSAESQFGRTLTRSGLHYDDVQCPQSDSESSAVTMQRHAVSMNREIGIQVINMPWRPGN